MTEEKKETIFQKIGWKLYIWNLNRFLRKLERKNKIARRKYCNKGYHQLRKRKWSWKRHKKRWVHVEFLQCVHCNWMFFTTKKQKDLYLKMEGKDKDTFSAFLKALSGTKAKRHIGSGRTKRGDVSSSCQKGDKNGKNGKN